MITIVYAVRIIIKFSNTVTRIYKMLKMLKIRKICLYSGSTCLLFIVFMLYRNQAYLHQKGRIYIHNQNINTINLHEPEVKGLKETKEDEREDREASVGVLSNANCIECFSQGKAARNNEYVYFSGTNYTLDIQPIASWVSKKNTRRFCDDRVTVYKDLFAILNNVKLDPSKRNNYRKQAKGGEEIKNVLKQTLDKEVYSFQRDFFQMQCLNKTDLGDHPKKMEFLRSLKFVPVDKSLSRNVSRHLVEKYVIAVRRQDYANLHNWVRNIYNTFLLMIKFKIQPVNVSVMFMDGHPKTALDKSWEALYGTPLRIGHMSYISEYRNFILGFEENEGPISKYKNTHVPYLEEFRDFVLSQFRLDSVSRLNCSIPRITVIIRRNAVYHPRNVEGNVGRKIFNEAELVADLMDAFPRANVKLALMEALPMMSQLDLIRQTDILIGMHGAGMSHVIFLPSHAGVLELFSKDFKRNRPWFECFHSITKWRNMAYESWENFDDSLEMPADFTILPTNVVVNKTKIIMSRLCPI